MSHYDVTSEEPLNILWTYFQSFSIVLLSSISCCHLTIFVSNCRRAWISFSSRLTVWAEIKDRFKQKKIFKNRNKTGRGKTKPSSIRFYKSIKNKNVGYCLIPKAGSTTISLIMVNNSLKWFTPFSGKSS